MSHVYTKTVLHKRIYLQPDNITKNYQTFILQNLKKEVEGMCIKEGYVKPNSTNILSRSIGYVEREQFTGNLVFDIKYSADICNPVAGQTIKCTIKNINKLGILAEEEPMSIIIARQYHENKNVFKNVQIGQQINVEVIGKRFELNDTKISIIAKLMDETVAGKKANGANNGANNSVNSANNGVNNGVNTNNTITKKIKIKRGNNAANAANAANAGVDAIAESAEAANESAAVIKNTGVNVAIEEQDVASDGEAEEQDVASDGEAEADADGEADGEAEAEAEAEVEAEADADAEGEAEEDAEGEAEEDAEEDAEGEAEEGEGEADAEGEAEVNIPIGQTDAASDYESEESDGDDGSDGGDDGSGGDD